MVSAASVCGFRSLEKPVIIPRSEISRPSTCRSSSGWSAEAGGTESYNDTVAISGVVTENGSPVANADVECLLFYSQRAPGSVEDVYPVTQRNIDATTDENGYFECDIQDRGAEICYGICLTYESSVRRVAVNTGRELRSTAVPEGSSATTLNIELD